VGGEVQHQLIFTPGESYPGLELEYELLDENGVTLKLDRLRVGAIFEKPPLAAGRETALRIVRPEDLIKVTAPRPRSPLDPPLLELDRIHRARLRRALRCHQVEWEWQPGMQLPPDLHVQTMPEPGTVFLRNKCPRTRGLRDASLRRTFRYHRRVDPARAWIDLRALYNKSYDRGVTLYVDLLDGAGRSVLRKGCRLQLRHPPVIPGHLGEYRIELTGEAGVKRAHRVKRARIVEIVGDGGGAREAVVEQVCE
jgi:hypothetical protein